MLKYIFFSLLALFFIALLIQWPVLGKRMNTEDKNRYQKSKHFKDEFFVNKEANLIKEMRANMSTPKLLKRYWNNTNETRPKEKIPQTKPNLKEFLSSNPYGIIWLGHSTLLIRLNNKTILIDPVFSQTASPLPFMVKRFQEAPLTLSELPPIDFVVISHDHYDHLDWKTISFFKNLPSHMQPHFIVPLGVDRHLTYWGIEKSRISAQDWWQGINIEGIEFIATPAQHFSGRSFTQNDTLWASWVFKTLEHSFYFSGDSGYADHFKEIGQKYGPFDLAFLEAGQYDEMWREVHMHPEETTQAALDLKAKKFIPIHWGMFELALHRWDEPIERLKVLSQGIEAKLISPELGQVISTSSE